MRKSKVKEKKNIKKVRFYKFKIIVLSGTVIMLSLIFTNLILAKEKEGFKTVLTINDEKITVSEFMLNYSNDKKESIEKLIENRARLNILKTYGIIESTNYNDILNSLKRENKRRVEAKEKKEVIYGPIQYSEKQYYEYILSNGQAELEFAIEEKFKDEINGKIQSIYYDNIEDFRIEDAVECEIISVDFVNEDGSINELEKEKTKVLAEEVRVYLNANNSPNHENVYKESYEFKYENKSLDENYKAELKEKALELQIGEVSEVIEFNGAYHILKCLNRYSQGYEELDVVKDQIIVDEINLIIDGLIEKEKENMRIEIEKGVLDKIV